MKAVSQIEIHPVTGKSAPCLNFPAAMKAGLVSGAVLLLIPQGIPWASLASFTAVVMGRPAASFELNTVVAVVLHMGISVLYAIVVAASVKAIRTWRGIMVGGAVGLGLYAINLGVIVLTWASDMAGETNALFAHLIFGLFTAAIYKGMTQEPVNKSPKHPI
jgi:hypothetical protein